MNAAKKMADGLGILDAISDEDVEKLEANIHDRDVIMDIVSQTYMNSNSYLERMASLQLQPLSLQEAGLRAFIFPPGSST
jgi:hypothetical protein